MTMFFRSVPKYELVVWRRQQRSSGDSRTGTCLHPVEGVIKQTSDLEASTTDNVIEINIATKRFPIRPGVLDSQIIPLRDTSDHVYTPAASATVWSVMENDILPIYAQSTWALAQLVTWKT